jgi:CBS domain-containing membrane protein
MKRNEPISHIMTPQPFTIHTGQKLSEARQMMAEGGFHHMPVTSGKKLVGLISTTDLLKASYALGVDPRESDAVLDHTHTVDGLMQKYPITLKTKQTVRDAVGIFAEGKFHSLPVIDDDENLVGMVTTTDVLRYMQDQY